MRTVDLSTATDHLPMLLHEVTEGHEGIRIARPGRSAVVLLPEDELDALHETLFWLSQPDVRHDLEAGRAALAAGRVVTGADLRARFGLP